MLLERSGIRPAGSSGLAPAARYAASLSRACSLKIKKAGQVTVELLLVLPIFMLMIFFIMEIGGLAYQTILVHHCAYELARIGSLVAGPPGGSASGVECSRAASKMQATLETMFPSASVQLNSSCERTGTDRQARSPSGGPHYTEDLLVTLVYPAKLVFPGSSYILADTPKANRIKRITVRVRMPIEKPLFQ